MERAGPGSQGGPAYSAPWWLPGGNLQSIWPALWSRRPTATPPNYRRERWDTPDGDFIDVDFLDAGRPRTAPLLVQFHGLEGSSHSHYALAMAEGARVLGWRYAVPHFRGCSGELNLAPRAYHSGDFEEIGWMLGRFRAAHAGPMFACGVSLGGNALLRWVQEAGAQASGVLRAAAAVSAPVDLHAAGLAIERGFNRISYTPMFLRTMKPKALKKLKQHPGLFDGQRLARARTLYEFDDVFTGPLHGFAGTEDYWQRGSSRPHLARVRLPTLVLNARNDPFVPAASLPGKHEVGSHVTLWQPAHGGHCGFPAGAPPGHLMALPQHVLPWLAAHL
jgi:uncharacterized protein